VFDLSDPGMLELARRLEAYADARLSPNIASTTRMRMSVMNAAHPRAARGPADDTFDAAAATTATLAADRRGAGARSWRRPVVAILATALTVGLLAGTVSASKPGGPLYATRLWIEMANLPAEVVARAQAEINRLDARIQEAQQASAAGDGPAVSAAMSAYSVIVVEAARGSAGDPTANAAIEVTVTRHVLILTLMVDSVPSPARDAVNNALSSSSKVLDDLDAAGPQGSQALPSDGATSRARRPHWPKSGLTTPANDTGSGVAAGQSGGPDENAAPDKSASPEKTSGPVRSPDVSRPAQAGTGGASRNEPTSRPTGPPADRKGAGPDKDGGT